MTTPEQTPEAPAPVVHRAVTCEFCKHSYIKPCTAAIKDDCPNYQALLKRRES